MTTGQRIKAARKKAGLTQEELGKKLGVSGSFMAQYETGKRNPKPETLQRIAAALGISTYELFDGSTVDEDGTVHVWPAQPKVVVHEGQLQTPEVIEHSATPEEMEELLAKLQDGEPLVLSPEELAKLKSTPKEQISAALDTPKPQERVIKGKGSRVLYCRSIQPDKKAVATRDRIDKQSMVQELVETIRELENEFSVINALRPPTPQARISAALDKLNVEGQEKAAERVEELTEIPRYQAAGQPTGASSAPGGTDTTPAPDGQHRPQDGPK